MAAAAAAAQGVHAYKLQRMFGMSLSVSAFD